MKKKIVKTKIMKLYQASFHDKNHNLIYTTQYLAFNLRAAKEKSQALLIDLGVENSYLGDVKIIYT